MLWRVVLRPGVGDRRIRYLLLPVPVPDKSRWVLLYLAKRFAAPERWRAGELLLLLRARLRRDRAGQLHGAKRLLRDVSAFLSHARVYQVALLSLLALLAVKSLGIAFIMSMSEG